MNYGVDFNEVNTTTSNTSNGNTDSSGSTDWDFFSRKLAELRSKKGEDSEEVQLLTKAANNALQSYYSSPAYKEWYENYLKYQKSEASKKNVNSTYNNVNSGYKISVTDKGKRKLTNFSEGSEDTDLALARAEEEIKSGDYIQSSLDDYDVKEDSADFIPQKSNLQSNQKKKQSNPPAWYEV